MVRAVTLMLLTFVNTLFGAAALYLQLEESYSALPTAISNAQSVHLGLCCVSGVTTWILAGEIKTSKAEARYKNVKNRRKLDVMVKG